MTGAEKKKMLQLVRIAEFLFSETLALKSVLLAHRISEDAWEKECFGLLSNPEFAPDAHARFQRLYDDIKQAPDEKAAVEALLQALPISTKPLN